MLFYDKLVLKKELFLSFVIGFFLVFFNVFLKFVLVKKVFEKRDNILNKIVVN